MPGTSRPRVEIEYCTQCRWLLRAAWMAQELLTTFEAEIGEVALVPGTGGVFEIQRGFIEPGETMEVPPARVCVPVIRGLLDAFRRARLTVVFTAFVYLS